MKVYQIVRFRRTYGYITVLEGDHALIKDLHGKMHSIKLANIQVVPGLENPVAVKDLHKDDFVAVARVYNDKPYGMRIEVSYCKVRSVHHNYGRSIGRWSIKLDQVPTLRKSYKDGDVEIFGLAKLDWKY